MVDGQGWFDDKFGTCPAMAILRGHSTRDTLKLAQLAWELGITLVEIPIQTEAAVATLAAVAEAGRDRAAVVGAGTVLSPAQVAVARKAGAAFTVSPGYDPDVTTASLAAGLPSLPGVATATDVQLALRNGHRWVKAFPASVLGDGWFAAMRGPFPQVSFVATGGIGSGNAGRFLDAGAAAVAVGSALEDPAQLGHLAAVLAHRLGRRPGHQP
jgi:2-dehydro-3-deoxyphosphogluconate aldolase / (4S)-4-hydroxy-2-oxoglutarate aldolase